MAYTILIVYSNVPLFLDYLNATDNARNYYFVFMGMSVFGLLFYYRSTPSFLKNRTTYWVLGVYVVFLANHILVLNSDLLFDEEELWYETNRMERFVMLPILGFLMLSMPREIVFRYLKIAAVIIPALVIVDFFFVDLMDPANSTTYSGRAEGMFINANLAAEAVLITFVLIRGQVSKTLTLALYVLAGVAVITTFSRAGIACWVVIGLVYTYKRVLPLYTIILFVTCAFFYNSIIDFAEEKLLQKFAHDPGRVVNMIDRLSIFSTDVDDIDDISAQSRGDLLLDGWKGFLDSPFIGQQYSNARTHNMVVEWMYTFGISGFVLWAWLLWLLAYYGHRHKKITIDNSLAILYLLFSFFTHNLLETFFWHFAFAMALYKYQGHKDGPLFNMGEKQRSFKSKKSRKKNEKLRWA